jgi:integrase
MMAMAAREALADEQFRHAMLRERLEPASVKEYVESAARVRRVSGLPLGYAALLRFFRRKQHLQAQTLRGYKSAVNFVLRLARQPLTEEEDAELGAIISGLECSKAEPERVRGAPSTEQQHALVAECLRLGDREGARALTVALGVGARANELQKVRAEDFDERAEVLWVLRKARRTTKARHGFYQDRPVMTEEALTILRALKAVRSPRELLFPSLNPRAITAMVKRVAARDDWDADVWWSGVHNMRHSAAQRAFRDGILATRAVGSWSGRDAEHRYGRQGRIAPGDRRRHQDRAQKARQARKGQQ